VSGQRLTQAQWKAEVDKMVGWGAPLSADQVDPVVAFLTAEYSDSTPASAPVRAPAATVKGNVAVALNAQPASYAELEKGASVFRTQCATCHGENARGADLGPNLVEAAVLLRPDDYFAVVRQGRHRMPGFSLVLKPEQERDVLAWLRSQRYDSAK